MARGTKPIVEVESLSKRYRLGMLGATSLRESIESWLGRRAKASTSTNGSGPRLEGNEFWALRDVSFTVDAGEVIGIVGRNGAGKSTLLKVLSRITEPSSGRAVLRGRVASLLEVGTGFHPELSGRENIFLNGAILGMKRWEIARKLPEIVEFAEIADFIDTPVKRYSSGMYVRLAFAVAAHLEPEILVVDEVLAVGDAQFQKRCLGKMQDVSQKDGRTVLFVSHNMQAVQSLCGRAVRLDGGRVIAVDSARAIVTAYLSELSSAEGEKVWSEDQAPGNELCKLLRVAVRHPDAKPSRMLSSQREVWIEFDFTAEKLDPGLCVGFDLTTSEGVVVFRTYQTDQTPEDTPPVQIGVNRWRCVLPPGLLNGGVYFISPRIGIHNVSWIVNLDGVAEMEVVLDHGVSPFWNSLSASTRPGLTAPILPWKPVLN